MVDGSGLKDTLERHTIHYLMEKKLLDFKGKNVLLVCGGGPIWHGRNISGSGGHRSPLVI